MTSRFEPDSGESPPIPIVVHAPEAASGHARFVVEPPIPDDAAGRQEFPQEPEQSAPPGQPDLIAPEPDLSWRSEISARVNRYRARHGSQEPRYPSLALKFDPPEPEARSVFDLDSPPPPPTREALAVDTAHAAPEPLPPAETGKLLEFPRPLTLPPRPLDELAEPVLDLPRILEVPEVAPPPPALGGILIEPDEDKAEERRPGFEIPLQAARLSRRLTAVAIDAFLVLAACALFAYLFFRLTRQVPPLPPAAGMAALLMGIFWAGYQFLALVFTGTTPGLRLSKLELQRFDGSPVPRNLRRWRVLASILSCASLGLGYAWCFLDEDQLCWHDRITRTYMAPKKD